MTQAKYFNGTDFVPYAPRLEDVNKHINDNDIHVKPQPYCVVMVKPSISLPNSNALYLPFSESISNKFAMWNPLDKTKITITEKGLYSANATIMLSGGAFRGATVYILKNRTFTTFMGVVSGTTNESSLRLNVGGIYPLEVGDVIEVMVQQLDSNPRTIDSYSQFSITKIGIS